MESKDNINPQHYKNGKIECIDAIESAVIGKSGFEGMCVGNIIKYLWRYEDKNGEEDVQKAIWYAQRLRIFPNGKKESEPVQEVKSKLYTLIKDSLFLPTGITINKKGSTIPLAVNFRDDNSIQVYEKNIKDNEYPKFSTILLKDLDDYKLWDSN